MLGKKRESFLPLPNAEKPERRGVRLQLPAEIWRSAKNLVEQTQKTKPKKAPQKNKRPNMAGKQRQGKKNNNSKFNTTTAFIFDLGFPKTDEF